MNTTQAPTLSTRNHRPYYSPEEVDILSEKQRGKLSLNQEEKARQRACSLIEAVGTRIGL
jgi:CTD kinase subunit beta